MTADTLLPANAAPFESALVKALSDVLPVPLRQIADPTTTPAEFVPFLAAHESVDLWFEDWPLARKREMVTEAPTLAAKKGTRAATLRFLHYVDAAVLDIISFPARFVAGRAIAGRTPVGHPAFVARHLVKVETRAPKNALVAGRGVAGRHPVRTPSMEPFRRVYVAMRAAKSPETQYRVDFAHKRRLTLADGPALNGEHYLGDFIDRVKL